MMSMRDVVERHIASVEKFYPGLRFSDRSEWTKKVAYLSYLETKKVGLKHNNNNIISEDTIGIASSNIVLPPGTHVRMLFQAIDLVRGSDGVIQWLDFGIVDQTFVVPLPVDISLIVDEPEPNVVPWVGYDEGGNKELKRQLAFDYGRRPQGADWDVSIWAARVFHSAYMGPAKLPLGMAKALMKHRLEWCAALGVPVIPIPDSWNIGDPIVSS